MPFFVARASLSVVHPQASMRRAIKSASSRVSPTASLRLALCGRTSRNADAQPLSSASAVCWSRGQAQVWSAPMWSAASRRRRRSAMARRAAPPRGRRAPSFRFVDVVAAGSTRPKRRFFSAKRFPCQYSTTTTRLYVEIFDLFVTCKHANLNLYAGHVRREKRLIICIHNHAEKMSLLSAYKPLQQEN